MAEKLQTLGTWVILDEFPGRAGLDAAAGGAEAVFLLVPHSDPGAENEMNVIDALLEAGIMRVAWNPTRPSPPVRIGNPDLDVRPKIL